MLAFMLEHRHRVLLSAFSGTLTNEDMIRHGGRVRAFEAREGRMRLILDFTGVVDTTLDTGLLVARAPFPNGLERVIVAPQAEIYGLARLYMSHLDLAGVDLPTPLLVKSRAEAHTAFDLREPDFQPITLD